MKIKNGFGLKMIKCKKCNKIKITDNYETGNQMFDEKKENEMFSRYLLSHKMLSLEDELLAREERHKKLLEKYKDYPNIHACPGYWIDMERNTEIDRDYSRKINSFYHQRILCKSEELNNKKSTISIIAHMNPIISFIGIFLISTLVIRYLMG